MATEDEKSNLQPLVEAIFQISPENSNRITTRESTTVEFKASFHKHTNKWDEYGKTIAAFANTRGGCLVFGIQNSPHELLGLSNEYFDEFDPAQLTSFLNSRFSPEIEWSRHVHAIEEKRFGLIRVYECNVKPVVSISNGGNHIKEAEIYYRYRGRSEKIRYSELKKILEDVRKAEQQLWMQHLKRIASIGVSNAAIFNPDDGTVTGKSGTFVIDRSLLPMLSFVREGEFKEITGAPAIKIIGEAQFIAAGEVLPTEYIERKAVRLNEVIDFFLLQKKPSQPSFFIEQACYEQTGYLPIYYFAQLSGLSLNGLVHVINSQHSHNQGKQKILERLEFRDTKLFKPIPNTNTDSALKKGRLRENIITKSLDDSDINDLSDIRYRFEVLRSFSRDEIDVDYMFPLLHGYYQAFWGKGGIIRSELYKAICHLDKEIFCPDDFYINDKCDVCL